MTGSPDTPSLPGDRIVALYLFDVAETIDLEKVPTLVSGPVARSRLVLKPATPAYVQYERPPLTFEGEGADAALPGWNVRFRVYDYGIISVALTRHQPADWASLVAQGAAVIEDPGLEEQAERLCRRTVDRLRPALVGARTSFLTEDYVVYIANPPQPPETAADLVARRGPEIALMLRGERQRLSAQEEQQVLQYALSYLADDLVIPSWNAAFVLDTPAGAEATTEILEFANSQLLQFRYYDQRLDEALASIYTRLQKPRWYEQWLASRYARAARQVHSLYIEVNELTDRTENALKFVGDVYAARLYAVVADRLGLQAWKANVQEKLKTLDDIYRFAVEQTGMARGETLELMIVLILIFELVLFFMGIMR